MSGTVFVSSLQSGEMLEEGPEASYWSVRCRPYVEVLKIFVSETGFHAPLSISDFSVYLMFMGAVKFQPEPVRMNQKLNLFGLSYSLIGLPYKPEGKN